MVEHSFEKVLEVIPRGSAQLGLSGYVFDLIVFCKQSLRVCAKSNGRFVKVRHTNAEFCKTLSKKQMSSSANSVTKTKTQVKSTKRKVTSATKKAFKQSSGLQRVIDRVCTFWICNEILNS